MKEPPEPIDSLTMKNNQDIAYEIKNAKEEYENAVQELEDFVEQCENGEEDKEDWLILLAQALTEASTLKSLPSLASLAYS